jgi:DNA topoisomerase IB
MKLRRSDPSGPGISRVTCGKGFRYRNPDGSAVSAADLARIKALVIPPAWTRVWICPHANGHIQATGRDVAGRLQYRYHDEWRTARDSAKHDRMLEFARALPQIRATVAEHLQQRGFGRQRVLAGAVRLLDLGFFRSGGDNYAAEHGTYGLATVLREHVTCRRGVVQFDFPAKHSIRREQAVADADICKLVSGLKRRRDDNPELLAFRDARGWHDVKASHINAYLKEISGGDYTAKDFRTWHATVLAAVGLAVSEEAATSPTARKRAVARTVKEVAHYLGNTPAVARKSYIDARVIDRYDDGSTVGKALAALGEESEPGELATAGPVEKAVVRLLRSA